MELVTEYPFWFVAFCALLGAVYAAVLYIRDQRLAELSKGLRSLLAALRFASVTILAFFLLTPLLQTIFREVEKPIVVLANDNSQSLVHGKDSAFYREELPKLMADLQQELGDKYEVATYNFGDRVGESFDFSYSGRQTDFSQFFEELYTRYSNRNLGAVVLASDGIYNRGTNPVYASASLTAPLYAIALGDTSIRKDVVIAKVAHNRLAYLGNDFPLEIIVEARQFAGQSTQLTVSKGSEVLFTKQVDIASNNFTTTVPVYLEAKETGIQAYTVRVSTLDGEVTEANNSQRVYIDVLDARQKILLLAHIPHPDVAALRNSIEANDNYEVTTSLVGDFSGNLEAYNLVILHQVPGNGNSYPAITNKLSEAGIPALYVLGATSMVGAFNKLEAGLKITQNRNNVNEVQAAPNPNFSLFSLSDGTLDRIRRFPPLQTPFGNFLEAANTEAALHQKIGLVATEMPLLLFTTGEEVKTGILCGEGIWRWRLADFAENGNHSAFNELIGKTVQYLSVKEDKSRFRVNSETRFLENEAIVFDAEVYNSSYELVNEPEVTITVVNEEGKEYPFTFSRSSKSYYLNAGQLPVGQYSYSARVLLGDEIQTVGGAFTVDPIRVELVNTVADHQLLFNLADRHAGELVYPANLSALASTITQRDDIKAVSYSKTSLRDLINLEWIFFLILGLLSLEWFLRKRGGAY